MSSAPVPHAPRRFHAPMLLRSLCAAALAPAIGAQAVWTVDQDGSGDFTEIQAAVDAAASGDVILIDGGAYPPVVIDGKGLRLHAQGAVTIFNAEVGGVAGDALTIRNIDYGKSVVLDRIHVQTFLPDAPSGVHVENCDGPVWIQGMFVDAYGAIALHLEDSWSVSTDRSLFQTNQTTPTAAGIPQPGPGALIEDHSFLYAYDTDFRGSHGVFTLGGAFVVEASDGGDGILLIDSEADLSGGFAAGGHGSSFFDGVCTSTGDGGSGAALVGASRLRHVGTDLSGAIGGFGDTCGSPGIAGLDVDASPASTVIAVPQSARTLSAATGLVHPGDAWSVEVGGQAGDLFAVFASLDPQPALHILTGQPFAQLNLHLSPAPLVFLLSGVLEDTTGTAGLIAPPLAPGVDAVQLALQGVIVGADGFPFTGTPIGLTLLAR